jgi:iron complex outermembrane receptor protein
MGHFFRQQVIGIAGTLAIFSTVAVQHAAAQGAAPPIADRAAGIEEVVVTAQKRAESIQDVPIAITAFTAEALEKYEIRTSDELQRFTPNLVWSNSGGAGSNIGIRGVTDSNYTTNQVGSVGVVRDEVGLNSPVANTFAMFDLERVEVLRGPQVALYGRSTTGGAVSVVTRRPVIGAAASGDIEASLGNFDAWELRAAGSMPLGPNTAVRLAVLGSARGGIYRNALLGGREGEQRLQAARLSLVANPGDRLELYAAAHVGRQRASNRYKSVGQLRPGTTIPCSPVPQGVGNGCVDMSGFADSSDFGVISANFPDPRRDIDVAGGLLKLDWKFDGMTLTSITAYEQNEFVRPEDADAGPANLLDVHIIADTDQFTQELRLASNGGRNDLQWIVGAYYLDETQDGFTAAVFRAPSLIFPANLRGHQYDQDDRILSAYGQLDLPLSARWRLSAGLRYSDESKSGAGESLRANGTAGFPPVGQPFTEADARRVASPAFYAEVPFDRSWQNWGGKLGIAYEFSDDLNVYAHVSKGFKGGTFNFAANVPLAIPAAAANYRRGVDPEKLTTYEVGLKSRLLDRSVLLNLALFQNDYNDQQVLSFLNGFPALVNAAESTIRGAEVELQWQPGADWNLAASLGILDATYDKFILVTGNFSGNNMVQAPDVTASALVRKEWSLGTGRLSAQASAYHIGKQDYDITNLNSAKEDAHSFLDARLAYAFGGDRPMELALYGKNLGDERYCVAISDLSGLVGTGQCSVNAPRTYGVAFRASF